MEQQLNTLMQNSPSTIRNSTMVGLVRIVALVLGVIMLLGGFVFLISGLVSGDLMQTILPQQFIIENETNLGVVNNISALLGLFGIVLGLLLLFTARLTKMLLQRNGFIFKLWCWWDDYERMKKREEQEKAEIVTQTND